MSESPCHDPLGLDRRAEIDVEVTMTMTICHAATLIIWHWLIYIACPGNDGHAIVDSEPVYGNLEFRPSEVSGDRFSDVHCGLCISLYAGIDRL